MTMSGVRAPRLEINGLAATVERVWELDLSTAAPFPATRVSAHKTVGMAFHLARLDAATQELFGVGLPGDRVRAYLRHALADDTADASVRVNVFRPAAAGDVSVM